MGHKWLVKIVLKSALLVVVYLWIKTSVDNLSQPFRRIVIFTLRACVFFAIFLIPFSFFAGRIKSISKSIDLTDLITNTFISLSFLISLIVAIFLTRAVEKLYCILPTVINEAKNMAASIKEKAKKKIDDTRETSTKITNSAIDQLTGIFKKILRR